MHYRPILLAALGLICVVGCGKRDDRWTQGRPPVYATSGRLLLEGESIADATISFQPLDAAGKPGHAVTDRNGWFKAQTFDPGDGLAEGSYRVAIQKTKIVDASGNIVEVIREPGGLIEKNFLPERYADFAKSGIEITIEAKNKNDLGTIELSK